MSFKRKIREFANRIAKRPSQKVDCVEKGCLIKAALKVSVRGIRGLV
jgi:hypothetical protein